jgi:hypothetical protein
MRLTIIAGLILGASLAVQSMLAAQAAAKLGRVPSAVGVHVRVVAPWYIAASDRPREERKGGVRAVVHLSSLYVFDEASNASGRKSLS